MTSREEKQKKKRREIRKKEKGRELVTHHAC